MKIKNIEYIVIHCSATKRTQDIGAAVINQWHRDRNWSGIGYQFVIRRDGRIEVGRPIDKVGAHAYGVNRVSWGICMVGGIDYKGEPVDNFTDEQYTALRGVVTVLKAFAPDAEVLGHRDLSPDLDGDGVVEKHEWLKSCPCFDVVSWWNSLKKRE